MREAGASFNKVLSKYGVGSKKVANSCAQLRLKITNSYNYYEKKNYQVTQNKTGDHLTNWDG